MTRSASNLRSLGCPLALLLGLVVFPDSTAQWQFALLLYASLFLMVWCGHLVLRQCTTDESLGQTFFLKACLGQFALLLAWTLVSPLIFVVGKVADFPSLFPLLAAVALFLTAWKAKSARTSFIGSLCLPDMGRFALLVFAAACLFKVGAYYSVRSGALGLDTHQHIYFTTELYEAGYLKQAAGSTSWLEQYPKGFHELAALWGLPGWGDQLGSVVKVMPALQLWLVVFSLCELCAIWLVRQDASRMVRLTWGLVIAAGLAYMFFRGTKFVYPRADLNSTGRLASAAVLLLPALAGCLSLLDRSRRTVALACAALPLAGALAVKFNPALAVVFIAASVPCWLATTGLAVLRTPGVRSTALWSVAVATATGVLLLVTDPFYLSLLASKSSGVASLVDSMIGLAPLQQAAIVAPVQPGSMISDLGGAVWRNLAIPDAGISFAVLPDSSMAISHKLMTAVRSLIWVGLGLWVLDHSFNRQPLKQALVAAMPAVVQFSLLMGTWANDVLGRAIAEVVGTGTIEASVLSTYAREFSNILVLILLPVHFVLSTTLLSGVAGRYLAPNVGRRWDLACAVAVVLLAGSLRWWPIPEAPPPEKLGWWQPVKESQVDEFQDLERTVPEDAILLAEAAAVTLNGRENWILPVGEAAAYLPFARRRYLFNVRLGDGYGLTFADLDTAFCKGTPATAQEFLRKHRVRFLFTVDPAGSTREQVLERTYCGIKYSALGLVYPAYARRSSGLAIYELRPH